MQTKWSMIRENSERIVRAQTARGGASMPSIFSTVLQYPTLLMNDEQ